MTEPPTKVQLRRQARRIRRAAQSADALRDADDRLEDRLRYLFINNFNITKQTAVSAYYPYATEADTRPLLAHLDGLGVPCLLPVVLGPDRPLIFRAWTGNSELVIGDHGVPAPRDDALVLRPVFMLIPLLLVDDRGYRLGYGGGYFDRTLARLRGDGGPDPVTIGIAHEAQRVDRLPTDAYDQPLDHLLTEQGLTTFANPDMPRPSL